MNKQHCGDAHQRLIKSPKTASGMIASIASGYQISVGCSCRSSLAVAQSDSTVSVCKSILNGQSEPELQLSSSL